MATKFVFRPTQEYNAEFEDPDLEGPVELIPMEHDGLTITRIRMETDTTFSVTIEEGYEWPGVTIDMIRAE